MEEIESKREMLKIARVKLRLWKTPQDWKQKIKFVFSTQYVFRNIVFEVSFFSFHPELFEVKGHSQKEKLGADVFSATG